MNNTNKNGRTREFLFTGILITTLSILLISLFSNFSNPTMGPLQENVPISVLVENAKKQNVEKVSFSNKDSGLLVFQLKNSRRIFTTNVPKNISLLKYIQDLNITNIDLLQDAPASPTSKTLVNITSFIIFLSNLFNALFPLILMLAVYMFFFKKQQNNPLLDLKQKEYEPIEGKEKILLSDVAGAENAKEEIQEIIDYLVNPAAFEAIGAKIPCGIILYGPPGVGKTLLAKAVAGEAGVPFLFACGSEFSAPIMSLGTIRLQNLFKKARSFNSPCIIFIDEIDSIGRKRSARGNAIADLELTLNTLLDEMDGFKGKGRIIVMAATNLYESLDEALTRAGRFDRKVYVNLPTLKDRSAIIQLYLKKIKCGDDIDVEALAKLTPGYSGASLALLVNEAAIAAVQNKRAFAINSDFIEVWQRLALGGRPTKSIVLSDGNRKIIAYHESGHAILASHHNIDVHIMSITPRGNSLGVTVMLPKEDEDLLASKTYFENRIQVLLAGRASEEIIYGKDYVHSGATDDIMKATQIATNMITRYGFSERMSLINYMDDKQYENRNSEKTQGFIDKEVQDIINKAFKTTKDILETKIDVLHALSQYLLTNAVIQKEELLKIMNTAKTVDNTLIDLTKQLS